MVGCPLSPLQLTDIGKLSQLPESCYWEFYPIAEYDLVSFDCVGPVPRTVNVLADQNSENINQVALKEGRTCIGTIGILLSERFTLLETNGSRFIFTRRVLVIDKIEPAVFYWQLLR